jgi:Family of unknown function (DUF6111)
MIRTIFTEGALFLSPFAAYALFLWATRAGVIDMTSWTPPVLAGLTIVALAAVIVGFVALAQFSGARPGSTYIPAHMENGRLVPGKTK